LSALRAAGFELTNVSPNAESLMTSFRSGLQRDDPTARALRGNRSAANALWLVRDRRR